jgi:hypothetical protein
MGRRLYSRHRLSHSRLTLLFSSALVLYLILAALSVPSGSGHPIILDQLDVYSFPAPLVSRRVPRNFSVYDAVIYSGESTLFYLRLVVLDSYVDWFVVCHSCMTFQGDPVPPLSFAPLEREISEYSSKVKVFEWCGLKRRGSSAWARESSMRQFVLDSIASLHPHLADLIINCDCDEIPIRAGLDWIFEHPPNHYYKFSGLYFMYSFRWYLPSARWIKSSIIRWHSAYSLQRIRQDSRRVAPVLSVVHCSFCFPQIRMIVKKLKSYCHHEYSIEPFINPNYIAAAVQCGKSIIPDQASLVAQYEGNLDDFLPIRHPRLEYLRMKIGFSDLNLTTRRNMSYFLKYIKCSNQVLP